MSIFTVHLQDKEATILGYERIEVLAIVPFRATLLEKDPDGEDQSLVWITQAILYCRTEQGITQICENDLMPEISEGIYCEEGEGDKASELRRVVERRRKDLGF